MRPRPIVVFSALFLAIALPLRSPADPPTTSPAYDLSSPPAAAASFARAADSTDAPALRAMMVANTDPQRNLADALADFIIAARRLAATSRARWPTQSALPNPAAAPINQDADHATINQPGLPGTLSFRRTGNRWLLDPADFLAPDSTEPADDATATAQSELLHQLTVALDDVAADIAADHYRTADDAESAVRQKLRAVVGRTYRHRVPATAPTTAQSPAR
jgi:hypothetical protein